MPKVSVIIPCYNHGQYIDEAVDSVSNQTFSDIEIIIVNDGSTDVFTQNLLKNYNKPKTRVLHTTNNGPAEARNIAIKNSSGKYILPLDADDLIKPNYLKKAVFVLEENLNIKIVYSETKLFGDKDELFKLADYSIENLLICNSIPCTAVYRRTDYDATNGYNKNMSVGYEDWDFWLSLLEKGGDVYKIPEVCFLYRIRKNSRNNVLDTNIVKKLKSIIFMNHINLYIAKNVYPIDTLYELKDTITKMLAEKELLNQKIRKLQNSKDYKIGNMILKPMRFVWRLFFKLQ